MTLSEIEISQPVKLTVQEAATIMKVTPRFLQVALQQQRFDFGVGVEMGNWEYYINTERFIKYMKGA